MKEAELYIQQKCHLGGSMQWGVWQEGVYRPPLTTHLRTVPAGEVHRVAPPQWPRRVAVHKCVVGDVPKSRDCVWIQRLYKPTISPAVHYSLNSTGPTRTPTPTRTSSPSACRGARGPFSSPLAGHARRSSPTCPRTFVRHARFSSRGCPSGMRASTHVRVLYTINYRVPAYKITRYAHP